jgi:hypothetical protein
MIEMGLYVWAALAKLLILLATSCPGFTGKLIGKYTSPH